MSPLLGSPYVVASVTHTHGVICLSSPQGKACCRGSLHPALEGEGEEVSAVVPPCHQKERERPQRLVPRGSPKAVLLQTPACCM